LTRGVPSSLRADEEDVGCIADPLSDLVSEVGTRAAVQMPNPGRHPNLFKRLTRYLCMLSAAVNLVADEYL